MKAPVFVRTGSVPVAGDLVELTGDEGRHAVSVRRLRGGESVHLVDRVGLRVQGVVHAVRAPDVLTVEVVEVAEDPAPDPRITVVQALAKGDHDDHAVTMCTEVGAMSLMPWASRRSVTRWRDPERGRARWQRVADEAAKQARRSWFPQVEDLADLAGVVAACAAASAAYVLHGDAADSLTASIGDQHVGDGARDVVVVVGPEGGIDPDELSELVGAGARAVRLGPSVLRTSTAGVVASALLLAAGGQWS